ncbi:hypothetical protein AB1Y20_008058 [Prymnesium parvum]|uniref:Peroxisomal membrane protein PEX16 n=1 Tax=Prymnesium parvum TaxID=97485 RepID=A0AB34IVB3_PRYPA
MVIQAINTAIPATGAGATEGHHGKPKTNKIVAIEAEEGDDRHVYDGYQYGWLDVREDGEDILKVAELDLDGRPTLTNMRHHFQILFQPPAVHNNGMESASVDMLHLIYLNVFKMLFSYTIHQNLPDAKKKLVRNYLKAASFYSYDAAADNSENPVMRWIGREVKKFIADAPIHLPFLLRLVAGMDRSVPSSWLVAWYLLGTLGRVGTIGSFGTG